MMFIKWNSIYKSYIIHHHDFGHRKKHIQSYNSLNPYHDFLGGFFLSYAAYIVVNDHSGNASSAVTKYPYSKHISRACNPLPTNSRVTFTNDLGTCRGIFFFFFPLTRANFSICLAVLCLSQTILRPHH